MKIITLVTAMLLCTLACAMHTGQAVSVDEPHLEPTQMLPGKDGSTLIRQKRFTCDVLSFGGKVNHSACAAHCLARGKRGGYCNSKRVCNCR